jgi:hypothetical protein
MFLILKDRPTVTLKVEPTPDSPEWEFDRWRVNEDGSWTDHMSSQFELAQLKRSARVECRYRRKQLA